MPEAWWMPPHVGSCLDAFLCGVADDPKAQLVKMTVKNAADAAGVSPKAVRLWEARGLLPPAQRTDAGYRLFTQDDVDVLRFIRQAKALDLTLAEIKDILDGWTSQVTPCEFGEPVGA